MLLRCLLSEVARYGSNKSINISARLRTNPRQRPGHVSAIQLNISFLLFLTLARHVCATPGTYTNIFFILRLMTYTDVCFFHSYQIRTIRTHYTSLAARYRGIEVVQQQMHDHISGKQESYRLSSTCGAPRNHTNVPPVDAHV